MPKQITHDGVVTAIDGRQVTVRFVQLSACAGCHARALCSNSSDSAEKVVIADSYGLPYAVGDQVTVMVSSRLAWTAVVYAFVAPLMLALALLFVLVKVSGSEMLGSLGALGVLALYFVLLYLCRNHLERQVVFELRHRAL